MTGVQIVKRILALDQPTFKWNHLKVEKLICLERLEQLSASIWTRVALALAVISYAIFLAGAPALAAAAKDTPENERLASSASPYLRLHSRDLVRWRVWGEEAFAEARKLDRPLMVSFGYTACHWCHVMQEKHFNDPAIAKLINDHFIPVLVDRERRTALDETYMLVTQALTQASGWPNTVFITPELAPFYGTPYIEPSAFKQLLEAMKTSWGGYRSAILADSLRISSVLKGYLTRKEEAQVLTPEVLSSAAKGLINQFDPFYGGIGQNTKFFQPTVLMFLLQHYERTNDAAARGAVERTLRSVSSGGIHDHIEGGFHRYTVDPAWRVPHFEKMLYDQALMAEVFVTAFRLTGKPDYAETARKTLDYILADLTAPSGGFYATRDAASKGEEGRYYVWTPQQLETVLGAEDVKFAIDTFGVVTEGDLADKIILNKDQLRTQDLPKFREILKKLGKVRQSRPKPIRDEKILTSWNGMAIASLAMAAVILGDEKYSAAAVKAGHFIWDHLREANGRLLRSHFNGVSAVDGELDDYAQAARGFLFLFDLTQDRLWLDRAKALAQTITSDFIDPETGDFFATRQTAGYARGKLRSDADQPSGNGAALDVLARLARRTPDANYKRMSEKAIAALSGVAVKNPVGSGSILAAADRFLNGETGLIQYAGNGVVRIAAQPSNDKSQLTFKISIAEGWHINAHKPLDDDYIATELSLVADKKPLQGRISYPAAIIKSLGFSDQPLAILENQFPITARLDAPVSSPVEAVLQLQSCSNDICLLPEKLRLRFSVSEQVRSRQSDDCKI